MVLPTVRDPRLGTLRRGGTLTDADHHLRDHPQHRRPGAARELRGAARFAAYAAGQAACVAHVAEHDLGAAAYAIEAVAADRGADAGRRECRWQRDRLPDAVRDLVLADQQRRNGLCWSVFDAQPTTGRPAR